MPRRDLPAEIALVGRVLGWVVAVRPGGPPARLLVAWTTASGRPRSLTVSADGPLWTASRLLAYRNRWRTTPHRPC